VAITRRRLLQSLAALGGAAGGLLYVRQRGEAGGGPEPEPIPASGPFPYLSFGAGVIERFESDYQRHLGLRLEPGRWPERAKTQLLLSTDFFHFDADESRVIGYVAFYDPAVAACSNPFARFV